MASRCYPRLSEPCLAVGVCSRTRHGSGGKYYCEPKPPPASDFLTEIFRKIALTCTFTVASAMPYFRAIELVRFSPHEAMQD